MLFNFALDIAKLGFFIAFSYAILGAYAQQRRNASRPRPLRRFFEGTAAPCFVRCGTDAGRRSADHRFGATDSNACAYGALMKTLPALFLAVVTLLTHGASLAQSGNMMGGMWGGGWMGGYGGLWMPILLVVVVALVVLVVRRK